MAATFSHSYDSTGVSRAGPGIDLPGLALCNDAWRREVLNRFRSAWPGFLALAGVGVSTFLSFRSEQRFSFPGFLHLALAGLRALYGGFRQATVIPVVAASCLR